MHVVLIIVEGPDGSGKSTLCEDLVSALSIGDQRVRLLHKGPPTQHPLDEYAHPLYTYRPGRGDHLVIDRWHIGELIYPRVLNRPTQLDEPILRYIELVLQSRGATVVHMTQQTEELVRRVGERGDSLIKLSQLDPARQLFIDVFRHVVGTSKLHTTGVTTTQDVEAIAHDAWLSERFASELNAFTTYVGSPDPSVLLLGDVRGPKNRNPLAPAFIPYPKTSGRYLMAALVAAQKKSKHLNAQHDWQRIGIANACDVDDPLKLWNSLGKPRVVALGVSAHRRLSELAIPHTAAPHPQWVRRFKHAQKVPYGRFILGTDDELKWDS